LLVLTRKPAQSIMIGDDVELTVLSVHGEKVRLGIQAPSDVPVHRTEIYREIQRERGLADGQESLVAEPGDALPDTAKRAPGSQ
jgi:carbon storage regulator